MAGSGRVRVANIIFNFSDRMTVNYNEGRKGLDYLLGGLGGRIKN